MVSFLVYDLSFLILFSLFVIIFLYKNRKNLKREGIIFLYKTKIGIKAINYVGKKFSRILHVLKYFVIATGFVLMSGIIYLLVQVVYTYIKFPQITKIIKAPPLMPLIPYFPRIFGVQSFFPNFYFTYFILALAIIAIVHEFSHGIFMRLFKIKIKSTGFVFLGPILGAFVEEDRKQFEKKKNVEQMAVLGAGTFANMITALIFFGLLVGFFYAFFIPGGYVFNTYSYSILPFSLISGMGNLSSNLTEVYAGNKTYFLDEELKLQLEKNTTHLIAYDDASAVKAGLKGVIVEINGIKITNQEDLRRFLGYKNPGDEIEILTSVDGEESTYNLVLGEHPLNKSLPYIGIASVQSQSRGIMGKFISFITDFKNPSTHYIPKWNGNFVYFVYNFLYWVALINILVALFNMLPLGILDGGRFFYLTILSITKSKKFAEKSFKFISYLIVFVFILIMLVWLFALR